MKFRNFLKRMLTGEQSIEISSKKIEDFINQAELSELLTTEFVIQAAVNLVANSISMCEFRTFKKNQEIQEDEYYTWNYEPNKNQNASQFVQEIVEQLLYKNECLVVEMNGELIIAESFNKEEFAVKNTIFTDVSRKGETLHKAFRMQDVLYFKLNNKKIQGLLHNVCSNYNNLITTAMEKYEKACGEKGTLNIDTLAAGQSIGNLSFEEVIEDLMNNRFKNYFKNKNAVIPLFDGFEYKQQQVEMGKSASCIRDITDLNDQIISKVSIAFNIPKALLNGDIADVREVTKNFLTFAIDQICEMMETEINRKRYGKKQILESSYLKIDTTTIMHTNIFEIAEKIDKLIASGMYCIDELRTKLKDTKLGTEASKKHWITKNYQDIDNSGEEQEEIAETPKGGDTENEEREPEIPI